MMRVGPGTAPPEALIPLREIDPDAELLHLGGDEWLLGTRGPNPAAAQKLAKQLSRLDPLKAMDHELGKEFQLLQICADGFRPVHLYEIGSPVTYDDGRERPCTWGYIVEDFRMRDFNWRTRAKAALQETRDAASLEKANAWRDDVLRDFAEAEGPSLHRHVFKRARGFLQRTPLMTQGGSDAS